jgi:hypothetical protein
LGRGGGELANVYRTGGIDHDNRTEPERARWFTPQLLVAAGTIKVAGTTVADAGPVPGSGRCSATVQCTSMSRPGKRAR